MLHLSYFEEEINRLSQKSTIKINLKIIIAFCHRVGICSINITDVFEIRLI